MHKILKAFFLLLFLSFSLSYQAYADTPSTSYETYQPPLDLMNNLASDLPQTSKAALSRINFYRKDLGLPLWVYDPELSKMGHAHADYVVLNCKAGRPFRGHFENPEFPGYSRQGDEAARTSGLSGGNNPLSGLESLMAGVYHRRQFLDQRPMRVGLGHRYDKKSHCGSTLFVSRPGHGKQPVEKPKRFVTFPADGMVDTPLFFRSEWPDPRPIQKTPEKYKDLAGYILSIHMSGQDAENFQTIQVSLSDSRGNPVPLWVTDPANPTWKTPPPEIEKIYAGYKGGNPFSKNSNAVFIIPKEPLKPFETYHVETTMTIQDREIPLSWSFQTRKPKQFILKPGAKPGSIHHYDFAASQLSAGDQLFFSAGEFSFSPLWFFQDISIRGAGKESTLLKLDDSVKENQFLFNFFPGQHSIENLSFSGEKGRFVFIKSGAELKLRHTRIKDALQGVAVISENSRLHIEASELLNIGSIKQNPFYVFPKKATLQDGKLFLGEDNTYKGINHSLSWGGVGPHPKENRIWQVDNKTLDLTDAVFLAADGETIKLSPGKYVISQTIHLNKRLFLVGSGIDQSVLIHKGKQNTYLFALRGQGSLSLKNLTLGEKGFFLYLTDESSAILDNVKVISQAKGYFAVLNKKSGFVGRHCDFTAFSPPFLFSLKDQSSYTLFRSIFLREQKIKVYHNNQVLPVQNALE